MAYSEAREVGEQGKPGSEFESSSCMYTLPTLKGPPVLQLGRPGL